MGVGINMPLWITVLAHLVTFAIDKAKHKSILIPVDMQDCIGHGILVGNYLAKCCDSLISQLLMYVGDRQSLGIKMAASHKILL